MGFLHVCRNHECNPHPSQSTERTLKNIIFVLLPGCRVAIIKPSLWEDTKGVLQCCCQIQTHLMQITIHQHTHIPTSLYIINKLFCRVKAGHNCTPEACCIHIKESQLSINTGILKGLMSALPASQDSGLVKERLHYKRQVWFLSKRNNGQCVMPLAWFQKAFKMQTEGRNQ